MCGWCSVDVVGGGIKEVSKAVNNSVALHTIDSYFLCAGLGGEHFMWNSGVSIFPLYR